MEDRRGICRSKGRGKGFNAPRARIRASGRACRRGVARCAGEAVQVPRQIWAHRPPRLGRGWQRLRGVRHLGRKAELRPYLYGDRTLDLPVRCRRQTCEAMAQGAREGPCRSGAGDREGALSMEVLGEVRSEEHTSELQSLMRISYAVFCL